MSLRRLFTREIYIRITDNSDELVSTIRYGKLYSISSSWRVAQPNDKLLLIDIPVCRPAKTEKRCTGE